jgi:hypothetical protein
MAKEMINKKDLEERHSDSELEENENEYDSHEKITKRLIPVLKIKNNDKNKHKHIYVYENDSEDEIDELSNYKVYINSRSESRDESKMDIYKNLNIELFKENSNKSRNQFIKNIWKDFNSKEFELPDSKNIIITKSHPGHIIINGKGTGYIKNPFWKVMNLNTDEYYIMYCGNNIYTYFSVDDFKEVINPKEDHYPSWYLHSGTGYITSRKYPNSESNMNYLHQVICKKHNEKKYVTQSVDHINRNKIDNRKENLRFATQSLQNSNRDKCKRKVNARSLPDGLTQNDLPKYVVYYKEKYGQNKDKIREWFNIEKHPKLEEKKRWSTSKSMEVSIRNKLNLAKEKLEELNL